MTHNQISRLNEEILSAITVIKKNDEDLRKIILEKKELILSDIDNSITEKTSKLKSTELEISVLSETINRLMAEIDDLQKRTWIVSSEYREKVKLIRDIEERERLIIKNDEDLKTRERVYEKNIEHLQREKDSLINIKKETEDNLFKIELSERPIYHYVRWLQSIMDWKLYRVDILKEISKLAKK